MDYRFAIQCWQDQAGDENAKANVFVDGVQVATEVAVTATSADSPSIIAWESTGLTAPAADTSFDIKVLLVNDYYVDASTDRNINVDGVGYITKAADGDYKQCTFDADAVKTGEITITDFTDFDNYRNAVIPTAVVGDQIPSDFWSSRDGDSFYTVVVWGGSDTGVTMTVPVINGTCDA
jgi:hypothetical protein